MYQKIEVSSTGYSAKKKYKEAVSTRNAIDAISEFFKYLLKQLTKFYTWARRTVISPAFIGGVIGAGLFVGSLFTGVLPTLTALSLTAKILAAALSFLAGAVVTTGVVKAKNKITEYNESAGNREAEEIARKKQEFIIKTFKNALNKKINEAGVDVLKDPNFVRNCDLFFNLNSKHQFTNQDKMSDITAYISACNCNGSNA